jgi:hypothetical protein
VEWNLTSYQSQSQRDDKLIDIGARRVGRGGVSMIVTLSVSWWSISFNVEILNFPTPPSPHAETVQRL